MSRKKLHIKKDDLVRIITGENKGEEGRVLEVDKENSRAIVEGKNLISKHQKPNANNPQGGILKEEAGIHISNLMLIDPATKKPSRIGRKRNEKGQLVRYFVKSEKVVK